MNDYAYEQPGKATLQSVGVDYITCTQDQPKFAGQLLTLGSDIVRREVERGNQERDFRLHGYTGYSAGAATVATREESVLVRISGQLADDHWREVVGNARNVTRLDLQATGRLDERDTDLCRYAYEQFPAEKSSGGRPVGCRIVSDKGGGQTLYLGSRSSDRFGRNYDKGAESGSYEPGWLYRWELELKKAQATGAALSLLASRATEKDIADVVYGWFWQNGVRPCFRRRGGL